VLPVALLLPVRLRLPVALPVRLRLPVVLPGCVLLRRVLLGLLRRVLLGLLGGVLLRLLGGVLVRRVLLRLRRVRLLGLLGVLLWGLLRLFRGSLRLALEGLTAGEDDRLVPRHGLAVRRAVFWRLRHCGFLEAVPAPISVEARRGTERFQRFRATRRIGREGVGMSAIRRPVRVIR
jgi:hypothetical protein